MSIHTLIPPLQHVQSNRVSPNGVACFSHYKKLENQYLASNTLEETVMPRNKFAKIWKIVDGSRSASQVDAQLRSYAREFSFSPRPSSLYGVDISSCYKHSPKDVLMHQNRIVTVDDLLYDILCFCHAKSDHGDVEATTALVQEHYTFVPSGLIADFVNACPTCNEEMDSPSSDEGSSDLSNYITFEKTFQNAPISLPLMMTTQSAPGRFQSLSNDGLKSLPMSREVSLYQGIPNGWQYYFPNYKSALNNFVKEKDSGAMVRQMTLPPPTSERLDVPRVPSIAPLRSGDIENVRRGSEPTDSVSSLQRQPEDSLMSQAFAQIDAFSLISQNDSGEGGDELKQVFLDSLL
ncbi:hypothetical protein Moror_649 [Moniliophthora roreri MCA 2997]|uniref:Integrase zinc-binding domain-containing protein n=2 Tax=Moniliophthora roreri TaxID=221103 RepID=V2WT02_MONRO|nr:hypothetical protein Moror_649 [Moniliophthora roreri MCA 2997]KAI3608766.1 hypothetical protein WG66_003764 [Moniliophthora roreri]